MNAPELMRKSDESLKARQEIIADKKENPNEPFYHDGVRVRYTPFWSSRTTDRTLVHLGPDDTVWAIEFHYTPWNIFKESVVWHEMELNYYSEQEVLDTFEKAGVVGSPIEDPYEPTLFHGILGEDVGDVVKVYKYLRLRKLVSLTTEMNVPAGRVSDLRWLQRNILFRNSEDPNLPEVQAILKELL